MTSFINYFEREWIKNQIGWYEVYQPGSSTNNGLESINDDIKDKHTLRKRLEMSEFLFTSCKMLQDWSFDRDPTNVNER